MKRLASIVCLLLCRLRFTDQGTPAVRWTLYTGVRATWNEAARFCRDRGGYLPVIHTTLKHSIFKTYVAGWKRNSSLTKDLWIGLYTPTPNVEPSVWERNGATQPPDVKMWRSMDGEPDKLKDDYCVRMDPDSYWRTKECDKTYSIVCEFYEKCCTLNLLTDVSTLNTVPTSYPEMTSMQDCWAQCQTHSHVDRMCVQATWNDVTASCSLSTATQHHRCFKGEVTKWPNSLGYSDRSDVANPPASLGELPSHTCALFFSVPQTTPPPLMDTTTTMDKTTAQSTLFETSTTAATTTAATETTEPATTVTTTETSPATTPAEAKTTSSPEEAKTTSSPEEAKTTSSPEEAKTTSSPEEAKTTSSPEEAKTTSSPEEAKTTSSPEEAKTTSSPEEAKTTSLPEEAKTTSGEGSFTTTLTSGPFQLSTGSSRVPTVGESSDLSVFQTMEISAPYGNSSSGRSTPVTPKAVPKLCPCSLSKCRNLPPPPPRALDVIPHNSTSMHRRRHQSEMAQPTVSNLTMAAVVIVNSVVFVVFFLWSDIVKVLTILF